MSLGSPEHGFSCPPCPAAHTMCVPAVGHLWPLHQGQGTVGCCVRRGDAVSAAIDVRVPRAGAARGRASLCRRPGLWIVRPLTPGLAAREPSEQDPAATLPCKWRGRLRKPCQCSRRREDGLSGVRGLVFQHGVGAAMKLCWCRTLRGVSPSRHHLFVCFFCCFGLQLGTFRHAGLGMHCHAEGTQWGWKWHSSPCPPRALPRVTGYPLLTPDPVPEGLQASCSEEGRCFISGRGGKKAKQNNPRAAAAKT